MAEVVIYHNPKCGTSRNTLAMIRNAGIEPQVIEYLKTPPTKADLLRITKAAGVTVRDLIRSKEALYQTLHLENSELSDDALLDVMLANPILINRPIVMTALGTKLCRPSELVLDILPSPQQGAFSKEDGELVIDAQGNRVVK